MKHYGKILTKQFLEEKYIKEQKTFIEILKLVKCSYTTLWRFLKKHNIKLVKVLKKLPPKLINCKNCKKQFRSYIAASRIFCSMECSNSYNQKNGSWNKGIPTTKAVKKKISVSLKKLPRIGIKQVCGGYLYILSPKHPNKTKDGYILEHRLVMEQYLDRYLTKKEQVHHINGIKNDNRIENLMLFATNSEHCRFHAQLYYFLMYKNLTTEFQNWYEKGKVNV